MTSTYADVATEFERWLKEATNEAGTAMKRTEPDDIDYWDTIKNFDAAGQNQPRQLGLEADVNINPDEPNIGVGERMRRLAYPSKTRSGAKTDFDYRDMRQVKRWAKANLPADEYNKTWRPCHEFWEKRHLILVGSKLQGSALATYNNMDMNVKAAYDLLYGHQKTNFIVRYKVGRLFFLMLRKIN